MTEEGFIRAPVRHTGTRMDNIEMDNAEMTPRETENRRATLRAVRKHLTRIHHDLNNPLSIISGNAQLLQELAKALQVSDDFDAPLKDVVAAVEQLIGTAEELIVLKNILAQLEEEES